MTKDSVLAVLIKEKGFVSGERISKQLGVSRMAVSAAVKALRGEGYDISSSTNKGYRLNNIQDKISPGELMACLPENRMEKVICLDTVDSTNRYLKQLAVNGAESGTVVIAEEQTRGRGRRGRDFKSPKSKGIYISFLYRPDCSPSDSTVITAWTAVACTRAIKKACGVDAGIKWVNDIILDNKKAGGILTEMSVESEIGRVEYIIIGIGINVNETIDEFDPELRDKAVSLYMSTGEPQRRVKLAAELITELDRLASVFPSHSGEYLEEYRLKNVTVGKKIRAVMPQGEKNGTAIRINDNYSLKVRFDDGSISDLSSGEISIRGMAGYM